MDDRFKFRAYLKDTQKMTDKLLYDDTGWTAYDGNIHYNFPCDEAVLIQSTGLKDKNGKLIFEGDILQIKDFCPFEVVYEVTEKSDMMGYGISGFQSFGVMSETVIIGNIHEHKHLLEEKE